jgi:phage baseplate assembly protein W
MASINFIQPKNIDSNSNYLYSDIHFDIQEQKIYTKSGGMAKKTKSDIKVDYDLAAIKNSIKSLFNTKKGQRPLYPEWGVDLEAFLFEPLNESIGYKIGKTIQTGIAQEPRVTLISLNVIVDYNQSTYNIELQIFVPSLSINTVVFASLNDAEGFIIE